MIPSVTEPPLAITSQDRPFWRKWPMLPFVFAAAGIALFFIYFELGQRASTGSDGAVIAQQGWDWAHGNLLLRGWTVPDITFYTIEVPEFGIIELIHGGISMGVVQVLEALNLTLLVLLAAFLAKGTATGREGATRALIAAGILVAPVPGANTTLMLGNPDHLATQIPILLVWLILDRARPRVWVPVTVAVLLAWARMSDEIVLLEAEIPMLVVCAVRMYRRRGPLSGQWYDASLAVAALAAEGIAQLSLKAIHAAGGFTAYPLRETLVNVDQISSHVQVTAESWLLLYGADFSNMPLTGSKTLLMLGLHLVGVLLAAIATCIAVRRFFSSDLMVQVLTVSMVTALAAYTLLGNPTPRGGAHDLMPVLPVGAVLAGRVLSGGVIRRGLTPVLAAALAGYLGFMAVDMTAPIGYNPRAYLATWLREHNLTYGFANYYVASLVSVDSNGSVMVVPMNHRLVQFVLAPWNSTTAWYNPALHYANFMVVTQPGGCPANASAFWVNLARHTWGPPAHTYSVAEVQVLVWNKNLLDTPITQVPMARPSSC